MAQEFRGVGKQYKKIAEKRFRLPRKVKKRFKSSIYKYDCGIKKLRISYKWLNRNIWDYVEDEINKYEKAYEEKIK